MAELSLVVLQLAGYAIEAVLDAYVRLTGGTDERDETTGEQESTDAVDDH